jgi:hypothetical protein
MDDSLAQVLRWGELCARFSRGAQFWLGESGSPRAVEPKCRPCPPSSHRRQPLRSQHHPRGRRGFKSHSAIRTSFNRRAPPLLIVTAAFEQPKWSATSATNSAFARPSIGGAFSRACQPPSRSSSRLIRAFGLTFIWMILALTMRNHSRPSMTGNAGNNCDSFARASG